MFMLHNPRGAPLVTVRYHILAFCTLQLNRFFNRFVDLELFCREPVSFARKTNVRNLQHWDKMNARDRLPAA